MIFRAGMVALVGATVMAVAVPAQGPTELDQNHGVGDSPDVAPAPAELHSDLTHDAVRAAMRKVADWQLERARPYFNDDWTFAALYDGFMAASATLGDAKYEQAMRHLGEKLN